MAKKSSGGGNKSLPAMVGPMRETKSVSIEQISNGFLVRESTHNHKGDWNEKVTYSPKKPVVEMTTAPVKK